MTAAKSEEKGRKKGNQKHHENYGVKPADQTPRADENREKLNEKRRKD